MALTIGAIKKVDNGARFYTCDLHLHSFGASEDVKDPTMTVQAIIDSAKQSGIGVLAITDHNSHKNIDATLEHAAQYAGELLVLPGVEVTTAHGHLLAYFSPENSGNVGALLSRIGIVGKQGSRDSHTTASMADVVAEVERLKGFA